MYALELTQLLLEVVLQLFPGLFIFRHRQSASAALVTAHVDVWRGLRALNLALVGLTVSIIDLLAHPLLVGAGSVVGLIGFFKLN